jgi:hypothetical protein
MRNALLILTAVSFFSVTLWGQYPVVPKTGEGRYDRSSETVFLPNRIFTHPSVFFKDGQTDVRPMRKWWRAPVRTVASLPYSLLEKEDVQAILLPGKGNPSFLQDSPGAERSFVKTTALLTGRPDGMAIERSVFPPTSNCRLTHQILDHLRPRDEMDFLLPANERASTLFP